MSQGQGQMTAAEWQAMLEQFADGERNADQEAERVRQAEIDKLKD